MLLATVALRLADWAILGVVRTARIVPDRCQATQRPLAGGIAVMAHTHRILDALRLYSLGGPSRLIEVLGAVVFLHGGAP
jgi:hypothetical protein